MSETIIVALITAAGAIIAEIIISMRSNRKIEQQLDKQQALTELRLEQLTKQVEKHNRVIERVYKLEKDNAIEEEKIQELEKSLMKIEK